jgi:hypothetical protein
MTPCLRPENEEVLSELPLQPLLASRELLWQFPPAFADRSGPVF